MHWSIWLLKGPLYSNLLDGFYFIQWLHSWEDEEELSLQPKLQLWPSQQGLTGLWAYGEMGDCSGKKPQMVYKLRL